MKSNWFSCFICIWNS